MGWRATIALRDSEVQEQRAAEGPVLVREVLSEALEPSTHLSELRTETKPPLRSEASVEPAGEAVGPVESPRVRPALRVEDPLVRFPSSTHRPVRRDRHGSRRKGEPDDHVSLVGPDDRVAARYEKFRRMGEVGLESKNGA